MSDIPTPTDLDERDSAGLDELAALLAGSERVVALTGAGVSTESGLPDYRGPDGLWRNRRFEELADIRTFLREPVEFWEFYWMRLDGLRRADPGPAHAALADLEREGRLELVVTQNVDGLHERAGSTTVAVHGSLSHALCLACDARVDSDRVWELGRAAGDGVPRCTCGEVLKPGVVLFGEILPEDAFMDAIRAIEQCDVLLVCGSSLAVAPVSSFAFHVAMRGGTLAILNDGPTEADALAHIRVRARLGVALPELVARVRALAG